MDKPEYDEIIETGAKYFTDQMTMKGWLGKTLAGKGFDIENISDDDIHSIMVRTILKLYETWEEDVENEEDVEIESDIEDDEDEEYDDDTRENEDDEGY